MIFREDCLNQNQAGPSERSGGNNCLLISKLEPTARTPIMIGAAWPVQLFVSYLSSDFFAVYGHDSLFVFASKWCVHNSNVSFMYMYIRNEKTLKAL